MIESSLGHSSLHFQRAPKRYKSPRRRAEIVSIAMKRPFAKATLDVT